jgi:tetraacyldisaccharide 4'-kinase
VFPAGPLRAPLEAQLASADALMIVGDGEASRDVAGAAPGLPIFHGRLKPDSATVSDLKARNVLAFAGIGDPDKFFATAEAAGIAIAQRRPFPDHHRFTAKEAAELVTQAERGNLTLLTTEKDRARMTGEPWLAVLATKTHVLPVTLAVDEADALQTLALASIKRHRPA